MGYKDFSGTEVRAALLGSTQGSLEDPGLAKLATDTVMRYSFQRYTTKWQTRVDEVCRWTAASSTAEQMIDRAYFFAFSLEPEKFSGESATTLLNRYVALFAKVSLGQPHQHGLQRIMALTLCILAGSAEGMEHIRATVATSGPECLLWLGYSFAQGPGQRGDSTDVGADIEQALLAHLQDPEIIPAVAREIEAFLATYTKDPEILATLCQTYNGALISKLTRNRDIEDKHLAAMCERAQILLFPMAELRDIILHPKAGELTHFVGLNTLNMEQPPSLQNKFHTPWNEIALALVRGPHAHAAWTRLVPLVPTMSSPLANTLRFGAALGSKMPAPMRATIFADCDLGAVRFLSAERLDPELPPVILATLLAKAADPGLLEENMESLITDALVHPNTPIQSIEAFTSGPTIVNRIARSQLKSRSNPEKQEEQTSNAVVCHPVGNRHAMIRRINKAQATSADAALDLVIEALINPGNHETRRIMADIWVDLANGDPAVIARTPEQVFSALLRFRHPFRFSAESITRLGKTPQGAKLASRQIAKALAL